MAETSYRALVQRIVAEGTILLLLVAWWTTSRDLPDYVLPGPQIVARSMARFVTDPSVAYHATVSFARVIASVTIAMALALAIAAAVRTAPILDAVVERRILTFLNSFPSVGWAILGVVWFQISTPTVLFIQTAIVLPFCIINALAGFRQIDADLDELGQSLTRSPIRRFFKLTLPLVAPFLIAGVRVAYGICWKIALVSELFGASSGLGFLLMRAQSTSDAAMVFACCLVIVAIYTVTDHFILKPLAARFSVNRGRNA
ncbi:MAG: ABC transporter permease subunit [Deltaproteobacteria bacterium]|nr:ABC transporter permease subunit [Deltaproteobacteria bacterium]